MKVDLTIHTTIKIILRILEIVCVVTAISITTGHRFFVDESRSASFFCDGSLMLAIILTPILLFFYVLQGDIISQPFEAIITFILAIFLLATGSIGIQFWNANNTLAPKASELLPKARGFGSTCIIGGLFYIIDAFYSIVIFMISGSYSGSG